MKVITLKMEEHFYAVDIIHSNYLGKYLLDIEKWLDRVSALILSVKKAVEVLQRI